MMSKHGPNHLEQIERLKKEARIFEIGYRTPGVTLTGQTPRMRSVRIVFDPMET